MAGYATIKNVALCVGVHQQVLMLPVPLLHRCICGQFSRVRLLCRQNARVLLKSELGPGAPCSKFLCRFKREKIKTSNWTKTKHERTFQNAFNFTEAGSILFLSEASLMNGSCQSISRVLSETLEGSIEHTGPVSNASSSIPSI